MTEKLNNLLGAKFAGFVVCVIAVSLVTAFSDKVDAASFIGALQALFLTFVGGNVVNSIAGAAKDAVAVAKTGKVAPPAQGPEPP